MREQLQALGVPYDEVLNRFLGKEDFYARMLKKFLEDKNFEGMRQAISEKRFADAFRFAHTAKGLCANLGLNGILEYEEPLTEELRNEPYNEEHITEYLSGAVKEYEKAVEVIKAL